MKYHCSKVCPMKQRPCLYEHNGNVNKCMCSFIGVKTKVFIFSYSANYTLQSQLNNSFLCQTSRLPVQLYKHLECSLITKKSGNHRKKIHVKIFMFHNKKGKELCMNSLKVGCSNNVELQTTMLCCPVKHNTVFKKCIFFNFKAFNLCDEAC